METVKLPDWVEAGRRWAAALAAASLVLVFVLRCLHRYVGAGHDDTYITLLAAEMLAEGRGFVNYNGVAGEIGSSLLHVGLLAGLDRVGAPDLYLANKLLGLACGTGTLLLLLSRAEMLFEGSARFLQACLAVWLTTWCASYCFWTLGGLETPMVGLLLTALACALAASSAAWPVAACVFLLGVARPEGFTYVGAVVLCALLQRRSRRYWLVAIGAPVLALAATAGLRTLFIGYPLPVPVMAKAGGGLLPWDRLVRGASYVGAFARSSPIPWLLSAGFVARGVDLLLRVTRGSARSVPSAQLATVSVLLVHVADVVIAGGDWMVSYRFIAPILPLLSVALVQSLHVLAMRVGWRVSLRSAVMVILVVLLSLVEMPTAGRGTSLQRSMADLFDPTFGPTLGERVRRMNWSHVRDTRGLRPFIEGPLRRLRALHPDLTIATSQAGYLPYTLRELGMDDITVIDTYGVTEPRVARVRGPRRHLGIEGGGNARIYMDPESDTELARTIQGFAPQLIYSLRTSDKSARQLAAWGWRIVWQRPSVVVFAHESLLRPPM